MIADGPRADVPSDTQRCREVRDIVSDVDWPCDVTHLWAAENLGLKQRVSSGIDAVFEQVDRAIILEDDCVAHPDFFGFCDELLARYEDDERVMGITGSNFQNGHVRGQGSYYFSRFNPLWGWATWRRAWESFDVDMGFWDEWHSTGEWDRSLPDGDQRDYWDMQFRKALNGEVDSWGYPWIAFNLWRGGLTATPNVNLITNVGFGEDSTHLDALPAYAYNPAKSLGPIGHPEEVSADPVADRYLFDHRFGGISRQRRERPLGTVQWALTGVGRRSRTMWRRWRSPG